MKGWILGACTCMALCGCSGYLTRGRAADMILSREFQFQMPITISIPIGPVWKAGPNYKTGGCASALSSEIFWARDRGFVRIQDGPVKAVVSLTDKGKAEQSSSNGPSKADPCQMSSFVIARRGKPTVTGLIIDGVSAEAEFDYQLTLVNGSEQFFSDQPRISDEGKRDLELQLDTLPPVHIGGSYTASGTATFRKYDDGWRIEGVRIDRLDLPTQ